MREIAAFDGLLIVHAEDPDVIDHAAERRRTRYADFLASRPRQAENLADRSTVIELARATGCRVHILHLSQRRRAAADPRRRRDGRADHRRDLPALPDLHAEEIPDGATQFKCCPPIREAANRDLLWDGLRDGTIDMRRLRPLAVAPPT